MDAGAREELAVLLAIPFGLGSTVLSPPTNEFNSRWTAALTKLRTDFPTVKFIGMNAYSKFNAIIAAPASYGLTNVTGTCKGKNVDPDTYLFWDQLHPTSYSHSIFADYAYGLTTAAYGTSAGLSADVQ